MRVVLIFLCQHQAFARGFRDGVAKLPGRFKPQVHGLIDVFQRCALGIAVGSTPGKFGHFGHKDSIFVDPINVNLLLVHNPLPFAAKAVRDAIADDDPIGDGDGPTLSQPA